MGTQHTRNVKAKVIPVITGRTGTISKSSRKYLNYIPGKHDVKTIENGRTGHCVCTLKSTNVEVRGNNITCTISCNHTVVVTCILETWFFPGI
jgi:hypothetical protein